jgi:hypothetical protein
MITPDEFKEKLQSIADGSTDREATIGLMQGQMISLLKDFGYEDAMNIFESIYLAES